jgi:hypothetical protein
MITILVDTREQKTPGLVDQYQHDHPQICKDLLFLSHQLEIGDLAGSNQIFEIKWGSDLYSSLNSNHLKDQLLRLREFCDSKGFIGHLVLADTPQYPMSLTEYKRAVQLAQKCGIWIHHKNSLIEGLECMIHYIRHPLQPLLLNLPVSNTKKDPFPIRVLSQIDGVSPQMAEAILPEECHTLADLTKVVNQRWQELIALYHKGREMQSLTDRVIQKIG